MSLNDKTLMRFFQEKGKGTKVEKTKNGIKAEVRYPFTKYEITICLKRLDTRTVITYESRSRKTKRYKTYVTYDEGMAGLHFEYFYEWNKDIQKEIMRNKIINSEKKSHENVAKDYGRSESFLVLGERISQQEDECKEVFYEYSKNDVIKEDQYKSALIELAEEKYYEEVDYYCDEAQTGHGERTFPHILAHRVRKKIALFEVFNEIKKMGLQFKIFETNMQDYLLIIGINDAIRTLMICEWDSQTPTYNLSKQNGMLQYHINTSEEMFPKRNVEADTQKLLLI
jgi:hypothetical protein